MNRPSSPGRPKAATLRRALTAAALVAAASTAAASPVGAAVTNPYLGSFGAFQNPQGLTVDQDTGEVLVLDVKPSNAIVRHDADGAPSDFADVGSNVLTGPYPWAPFQFGYAANAQVAVDRSGTATDGTIYVTDYAVYGFEAFSNDGSLLATLNAGGGGFDFGLPKGLTVGRDGAVYLAEAQSRIHRFGRPDPGPVSGQDWNAAITGVGPMTPRGRDVLGQMAVDSMGAVYATIFPFAYTDDAQHPPGKVVKFAPSAFGQDEPARVTIDDHAYSVVVDPSNDEVYVDNGDQISRYDAAGTLLGRLGAGALSKSDGVAINATTGRIYATDRVTRDVRMFGPPTMMPDLSAGAITGLAPTVATINGTVNPQSTATTVEVEYGKTDRYGLAAPAPVAAGSGSAEQPVSFDLAGLQPETTYHYRLNVRNAQGALLGEDRTFRTPGPDYVFQGATEIATTSARLDGTVDLRGLPGSYRFYVAAVDSPYTGATAEVAVPAGTGPMAVSATIEGLPPGAPLTVRLGVKTATTDGYTDAASFTTVAEPSALPAPRQLEANPYGCVAPRLCGVQPNTVEPTAPNNRISAKATVRGTVATLRIAVPGPGALRVSGAGLVARRVTAKAKGTVTVKVALSASGKRALKGARSKRVSRPARLTFTPSGGTPSTTKVALTFKRSVAR